MDVFSICAFETRSVGAKDALKAILDLGMPVNITLEDIWENAEAFESSSELLKVQDPKSGLMHVVVNTVDASSTLQLELALGFIEMLLEFGASWMLLDAKNRTPGCIAYERGLTGLYDIFVRAGVRSEIFLQRMTDPGDEDGGGKKPTGCTGSDNGVDDNSNVKYPESRVEDYLTSDLNYDGKRLTTDMDDGVMMDWETPIMKRSAVIIAPVEGNSTVLNIGFGMGIIDTALQLRRPAKHYIVEAHPQVLDKMRRDGWYNNHNVVILEGKWQDVLPQLLRQGIKFDGVYYDTFSEHYADMLDLFDIVCGLLEFDGIFSFFNGLGADRQICYDVYKQVVKFDLQDYGLDVEYEELDIDLPKTTWDGLKRPYFNVDQYALPKVRFMQ